MEMKKLEFTAQPQGSTLIIRLPQISLEPIKLWILTSIERLRKTGIKTVSAAKSMFFTLAYEVPATVKRSRLRETLGAFMGRMRQRRPSLSGKRIKKVIFYGVLLVIIFFGLKKALDLTRNLSGATGDKRIEVQGAKSTMEINREFEFPLHNEMGDEVSKIKYAIQNAELRDEIIVKGQRASAVKGRTFLILNIKIANEFDQAIEIDTRDYVRLSVNNKQEEKLAPDIHNDPVEVQAISTKLTRLGFPINDTDKNFKLYVGEISSEKQVVDLVF